MTICDPITLAGVALTAGSVVANSIGADKVQKARDQALAADQIRQQGLDQQADAINARSRERYDDFGAQETQRSQDLGDYFAGQNIQQGSTNAQAVADMNAAALPTTASGITVQEENKQREKARNFTEAQGRALGTLRAFGDLMGELGRGQGRDAQEIGQIGGFKQGFANVLPYQLEQANKAGDGYKLFGDLLGLGGSVATAAGLGGAKLPALFGAASSVSTSLPNTSAAAARAADRASVPGYSAVRLYG